MVSPHLSGKAKPEGKDTRLLNPGTPFVLSNPSQTLNRDSLLKESCCNELSNTIIDLVNTEGPIHHDFLVTRLKEIHRVAKAGSNVQSNIKQALRSAENKQAIIHNAKPSFYCSPDGQIKSFRLPTETVRRPIEYIAPSELSLAVLYFVEDQFGVVEEYLPTAIARLFGIERLGGESADIIRHVIKELVSKGSLRRNGMQVHLG